MKITLALKITFDAEIVGKSDIPYSDKIIDIIFRNIPSVINHIDNDHFITVNTAQIEEIK